MNIHNRFRLIYFARVCTSSNFSPITSHSSHIVLSLQSGQSLIEHSYKADSDLSPAGWEYAERLRDFVLERRAKSLEQRGLSAQNRRLVVRLFLSLLCFIVIITMNADSLIRP
jgi:6-phosphofructo-2-kinase / fructose-2,6-biphosphatase 4